MISADIPQELIDILDRAAGRAHTQTGSVVTALADILTAYDRIRESSLELWDTATIAKQLGVSVSRVRQIKTKPRFPKPAYHLNGGSVWIADQVRDFVLGWERTSRPCRPRRCEESGR